MIKDCKENYYKEGFIFGVKIGYVKFGGSSEINPHLGNIIKKANENPRLVFSEPHLESCTMFAYIGHPINHFLSYNGKLIDSNKRVEGISFDKLNKSKLIEDLKLVGITDKNLGNSLENSIGIYRLSKVSNL